MSETTCGYWQQIQTSGRPLFLPDIGTYFNQDMQQAEALVDSLAEAGVTTIKGEILQTAEICLDAHLSGNERYWGHKDGQVVEENYRALIERKVLPLSAYETLFRYAQRKGMDVVVSVYDFEGADFAKQIGCKAIKIASSNVTHQPLIEYIATLGLPTIFDTGHTSLEEAARAVNWATDQGATDILVEHSPPGPPNPPQMHNLKFMQTLGHSLGVPYGLSDHHGGEEMLYAATAMGALVLEKGVCPDDMGNEQDGGHAMPVSQVKSVLGKIHNIADALGNGIRHLDRKREKYVSRMGLVAKQDLQPGDIVSVETVHFAFPAKGIKTEYWSEVVGHCMTRPVKAGEVIDWPDIQFNGS
ncbi:N-acetylneuraminate synthase family protein [Thiomicrorhabdus sp. zzn3]|uniref:N-acetylneuraminate synthase family protein n=1 Tax=Thiomicrorhabdus sp. zzn3 TaxID=3039775 RepID=UPI00243632DC|nr:N-acetylneuraminate synthase family protein [Thiomicrorhabdus sp. zzn3]MDG6777615.1 N-acetylneuraminate synthase family protein [Thiomicrorhabdus sp. zzn3]